MRAAILSIGDELTTGQTPDANASWLAGQLAAMAVTTVELRVVPGDRAAIAVAIREMAPRCDLLLATGGIGPTADDVTSGELDGCRIFVMPGPLHEMRTMFREHVGPAVSTLAGAVRLTEQLAAATVALLCEQGRALSTAESCTGGWLGKLIVDVPGSSECYLGGWVTYSDDLKTSCLAVDPEVLREHGAVSDRTARAMALGALEASGADDSLAVTGIAGPGGAAAGKPVGTVFIGLARRAGDEIDVSVRRFLFPGDRTAVRDRASKSALQILRFALLGVQPHETLRWEVAAATPCAGGPTGGSP